MTNGAPNSTSDPDQVLFGYVPTKGPGYPVRLDSRLYSIHDQIGQWSYPKLIEEWTKWVYTTSPSENAAVDYKGNNTENQRHPLDNVFFLAGTFGGTAIRQCNVTKGKNLFFPIISDVYTTAELPARVTEKSDLLAIAQAEVNSVKGMSLTFDGMVFYHYDLVYYRCQSSFDLTFSQPSKLVPTIIPQQSATAVADGFWIGIKHDALDGDDEHVIHFFATADDGYTQDVTYFLTMVQ